MAHRQRRDERLILPNYKHTWANIRKTSDAPASAADLSFKTMEYSAG